VCGEVSVSRKGAPGRSVVCLMLGCGRGGGDDLHCAVKCFVPTHAVNPVQGTHLARLHSDPQLLTQCLQVVSGGDGPAHK
jgi:hypothetical protein